ncbi:FAR-17a/AIG1-like protein [Entamoeba marina]
MGKQLNSLEKECYRYKALFRMIFDICVVTFIVVISTEHMITHDYTFSRMCRFWTMWSCWSCALYFFIAFSRQLYILMFNFNFESSDKSKTNKMRIVIDAVQQLAVTLCLNVTTSFWILYFKSPTAVFRVGDDWEPSFIEQLFVTHFEHSFPLMFLLFDCLVFSQGNKHVSEYYKYSKILPMVAFVCYTALSLYDFFRYSLRPYPFLDGTGLGGLLLFCGVYMLVLCGAFSPVAFYIRKMVKIF